MKYKYLYLVSYRYESGWGDIYIDRRKKVKSGDDLNEIKETIKKNNEYAKDKIVLINVQLIK